MKYDLETRIKVLNEWREYKSNFSVSNREASRMIQKKYGITRKSIETWNKQYTEEQALVITKQVLNANGDVVTTTKARRENEGIDTTGMQIERVTTLPHGGAFVKYKNTSLPTEEEMQEKFVNAIEKYQGDYKKLERKKSKDSHLLIVDLADIHIGKLATLSFTGDEYNIAVAKKRVTEGLQGLIEKSSGFNIDKILLVIGNDALHIDSPNRKTTSGTPQDTASTWYDCFLVAHELYVYMIETLITVADIHVHFNPSNHDYMSGGMLAKSVQSWFKNSKNITFDIDMRHRKYFKYGQSLIGTTHGDGAKEAQLPQIMATESKELWADTTHRYWYCHHLHHKIAKDLIGATVEYLRSPSSADRWHNDNGYISTPACEGFVHSKKGGQVARLTSYCQDDK